MQRLAGIENVAIGIDAGKHGGITLESAKAEKGFNGARGAVDGLLAGAASFNNLVDESVIARIAQQLQIGHFVQLSGLRGEDATLLAAPIQQALDFRNIPFLDHRADGDAARGKSGGSELQIFQT